MIAFRWFFHSKFTLNTSRTYPKMIFNLLVLSIGCAMASPLSSKSDQYLTAGSSDECLNQLFAFYTAVLERDTWALQMWDSWGKINAGYFTGNLNSFGRFTECLSFRHNYQNDTIQGKYCLVSWSANPNRAEFVGKALKFFDIDLLIIAENLKEKNVTMTNGICLPAICSTEKILDFLNSFLSQANLKATKATCQTDDPVTLEVFDIVAIILVSALAGLLIASTAYDVITKKSKTDSNQLLCAFSVYTNAEKLFEAGKSQSTIDCLLGLRAMSVLCLIVGHRFLISSYFPLVNPLEVLHILDQFYSSIVFTAITAVDTFILMGGMLFTISMLGVLDKKKFSYFGLLLLRYMQYTPAMAATILCSLIINKFAVQGPVIDTNDAINCREYWWSALLHVQNYVNYDQLCLAWTWYLSVDFQMVAISPAFIYAAWKFDWKFLWTLPIAAILICIYNTSGYIASGYKGFEILAKHNSGPAYYHTHLRAGTWLVGIVLGHIIFNVRGKNIKLGTCFPSFMWLLSLCTLTTIFILAQMTIRPTNNQTSLMFSSIFFGFFRLAWAVAIAWIILACQVLKSGGIIRWLLSLQQWRPISTMGLSIYLIHPIIQSAAVFNLKDPLVVGFGSMMYASLADIVAAIICGSILYLSVEAPFSLIVKHFMKKREHGSLNLSPVSPKPLE